MQRFVGGICRSIWKVFWCLWKISGKISFSMGSVGVSFQAFLQVSAFEAEGIAKFLHGHHTKVDSTCTCPTSHLCFINISVFCKRHFWLFFPAKQMAGLWITHEKQKSLSFVKCPNIYTFFFFKFFFNRLSASNLKYLG